MVHAVRRVRTLGATDPSPAPPRNGEGSPGWALTIVKRTALPGSKARRAPKELSRGTGRLAALAVLAVALLGVWAVTSPTARRWRLARTSTEALRAQAEARPGDAMLQLTLGRRLAQEGDAAGAVVALQRAVEADGYSPKSLAALGQALARAGRDEEAFRHLRAANARGPRADALRALGALYLQHDRPDKALPELEQAVRLTPDDWEGWQLLALARQRESNWTEATAALRRAVALRPDDPDLRLALGEALLELGQPDAAEPELRRALAARPSSARAHSLIGRLSLEREPLSAHAQEAETELRRALALDPSLISARDALADLLMRTDRPGEAERELAELLRRDPSLLQARFRRAQALRRLGRTVEAEREMAAFHQDSELAHEEMQLRGRLTLRPDDPSLHERLGRLLQRRGQLSAAKTEQAEAQRLRRATSTGR
jgi:predicted Zn-dependent protease